MISWLNFTRSPRVHAHVFPVCLDGHDFRAELRLGEPVASEAPDLIRIGYPGDIELLKLGRIGLGISIVVDDPLVLLVADFGVDKSDLCGVGGFSGIFSRQRSSMNSWG